MDKLLRDKKAIAAFVLPAMLVYACIVLVPIVWAATYTVYDGVPGLDFRFVGSQNFTTLFRDRDFWMAVTTNLKYVAGVVTGQIGLGLLLAFMLMFGLRSHKNLVRTILFFPVVLPSVAIGQMFVKILEIQPQYGLFNSLLEVVGLGAYAKGWLGESSTALICCIIADIWKAMGLYATLFYSGLLDIPGDVIEASQIDGATGPQRVRYILLPMLKPIIMMALVLSMTGTLKVFDSIYALTGGGPGNATRMPTMYMQTTAFVYQQYGYGSTIAIFIMIECLFFSLIINKLLSKDNTI